MVGGVLIVAATAAGVVSIIYSWVEETVSSSRVVINVTARGVADVIETVFVTAESVIKEFGSCTNRIAGRVGYAFEMTVERTRECLTALMVFLRVLLGTYLVVVIGEDEGLGNVHGVVPTIGRSCGG